MDDTSTIYQTVGVYAGVTLFVTTFTNESVRSCLIQVLPLFVLRYPTPFKSIMSMHDLLAGRIMDPSWTLGTVKACSVILMTCMARLFLDPQRILDLFDRDTH